MELHALHATTAANKIKRAWRKLKLKTWFKASHLQQRKESLAHELEQLQTSQRREMKAFKKDAQTQQHTHETAMSALQAGYKDKINDAMGRNAMPEVVALAQESEQAQKKLEAEQQGEQQQLSQAHEANHAALEADVVRIQAQLQNIQSARADKKRGVEDRTAPITGLSLAIHQTEAVRYQLSTEQQELIDNLKESSAALHHPHRYVAEPVMAAADNNDEKNDEKKDDDAVDPAELQRFFHHIASGEQNEAEEMLKEKPELMFAKGRFDDISDERCLEPNDEYTRVFKNISAWQYAVWALDHHMCQMMVHCCAGDGRLLNTGLMQHWEVRQGKGDFAPEQHGIYFDLTPLIEALQKYAKQYDEWDNDKREHEWGNEIGGLQRRLPMHVIREYCHPKRPFNPCPDFLDDSLPQDRSDTAGLWLTPKDNEKDYTKGQLSATIRSNDTPAIALFITEPEEASHRGDCKIDAEALDQLQKIRAKQTAELPEVLNTAMHAHVPSHQK